MKKPLDRLPTLQTTTPHLNSLFMKNSFGMKNTRLLILAAMLSALAGTGSAQIFLTDNFTVDSGVNDANYEITDGRQGGIDAVSDYVNYDTGNAWNHQVGNATELGQPAGDGNYLLLAQDGAVQNDLNLHNLTTGPLSISFTLYNRDWGHPGDWGAFTVQAAGTYPFPVVNANEFGFLNRNTGGIQVFDGAGNITPSGWDTVGFATNNNWTFIFSDTTGTGSAFNGNGSQVTIKNGVYTLGTVTMNQLSAAAIEAGFRAENNGDPANYPLIGIDNLAIAASVPAAWLPYVIRDTSPSTLAVAVGGNAVFTAAFSNSPPVSFQWQQVPAGSPSVTNNINAGVINVTNNGVVTSTLTLSNAQLTDAASYQLQAVNATNSAAVVYTTSASLTVVPEITWYAPGTGNGTFSTDSVLTFAGSTANEVYGVDFGGSGTVTTDNGYSFNDYAGSGNMSIANSAGLVSYTGYEGGSVTTGDNGLDTILDYGVSGTAANTATLNNLTVGQAYTVLVLMDDNRTSGASGPAFDVTDGLTASPSQTFAFPNGSPAVGGFIMGTFTAKSTNQPLTVLANGSAQYIAILLETGTAPSPLFAPTLTQDITPLVSKLSPGAPVTLSVAAAGSPPLHYQWFNQDGSISGATNASYTFDAMAGDSYDTNSYYCTVTNAAGGVTSSTGEVISSTNFVSVYNFAFEDGTFGGGNLVFPVDWTPFNNNNFSTVANNSYNVPIPDGSDLYATGDFYAVNEGPGDPTGGIYQDVGALLPYTTYTLTVAIGERADFTPGNLGSPGIISLINGSNNAGVLLASTNGVPNTSDTWQDYTVSFSTGHSVSGDLTVELSVVGASTYQANFANVRLTKAPGPSIIAPTLNQDVSPLESRVTAGSPVTFSVVVNGYPLFYQWYNQYGPITGATNSSYSFTALNGTNAYYVTATNSLGSVVSSTAQVVSSPSIVTANNFSFEINVANGPGTEVPSVPSDWTAFNEGGPQDIGSQWPGGVDYTVYNPMAAPADGNQYCFINMFNPSVTGGIYQDVGPLQPNTIYTLTVAIGSRADRINSPGIISLINGANNTGTLLASGGGLPSAQNTWQDYAISYTTRASVSGDLTIELSVLGNGTTIQADFDNVRLTKAPYVAPPALGRPQLMGGNLILTGSGGPANTGYTLLTTTNLTTPIAWTTNNTGTFDNTGAFSNSIPIGNGPARFFWLRTP